MWSCSQVPSLSFDRKGHPSLPQWCDVTSGWGLPGPSHQPKSWWDGRAFPPESNALPSLVKPCWESEVPVQPREPQRRPASAQAGHSREAPKQASQIRDWTTWVEVVLSWLFRRVVLGWRCRWHRQGQSNRHTAWPTLNSTSPPVQWVHVTHNPDSAAPQLAEHRGRRPRTHSQRGNHCSRGSHCVPDLLSQRGGPARPVRAGWALWVSDGPSGVAFL